MDSDWDLFSAMIVLWESRHLYLRCEKGSEKVSARIAFFVQTKKGPFGDFFVEKQRAKSNGSEWPDALNIHKENSSSTKLH